jgi:hypothetical protein
MSKSAGSAVRSGGSVSPSNGSLSSMSEGSNNTSRRTSPMSVGSNSNVTGPRRSASFQTASGGTSVGFNSGPRLGNSSKYNSFITANSGGESTARTKAGDATESRLKKSPSTSFNTAKTPQTMQRNTLAGAAEKRSQNIVPQHLIETFKQNVSGLEKDLPRNISGQIATALRSKPISRGKFSNLKRLLNNGKRQIAEKLRRENEKKRATSKRRPNTRKPIKSIKPKSGAKPKTAAQSRQRVQRSSAVGFSRMTITNMKEILKSKHGFKNDQLNLGRTKKPYINAIMKARGPVTAPRVSASKIPKTAAQGANAYLKRKRLLENKISKSSIPNNQKQNLIMKLQTGNLNQVQKKNNEMNTSNIKISKAKALIELYKSKITDRSKITNVMEVDFANKITKFNITTKQQSIESEIKPEDFLNLLLIMWLDGIHDKYINITFREWLDHPSIKSVFLPDVYINSPMFTFLADLRVNTVKMHTKESITPLHNRLRLSINDITLTNNNIHLNMVLNGFLKWIVSKEKQILKENPKTFKTFSESFIKNLGFTDGVTFGNFQAGWEKNFKTFLLEKYKENNNVVENVTSIKANDKFNVFLLAIDQEYASRNERPLTNMINNSDDSVQSLVTYGQAFDPGSTMLPQGIVPDLQNITVNVLNPEKQKMERDKAYFSPAPWYYLENFVFKAIVNGSPVMKIDFNAENSELKINDKPLSLTVTGRNAGKIKDNPFSSLGKYFGDGLQYFIASNLTKQKPIDIKLSGNNRKTNFHSFLGSGDGMALFGYDFVCTKLFKSKAPNMVIDFSGSSRPIAHIVNFPSGFTPVKVVVPRNRKGINNVQSYNQRSTQQLQTSNLGGNGNTGNTARSKPPKANSPK